MLYTFIKYLFKDFILDGIIKKPLFRGSYDPYGYVIEGEDGIEYFAHIGDFKEVENQLYQMNIDETKLNVGDYVDFSPQEDKLPRAIHVTKRP